MSKEIKPEILKPGDKVLCNHFGKHGVITHIEYGTNKEGELKCNEYTITFLDNIKPISIDCALTYSKPY